MDWEGLFGGKSPIVLDLGCGNGRFVLASALRRPEMDHLGLDILPWSSVTLCAAETSAAWGTSALRSAAATSSSSAYGPGHNPGNPRLSSPALRRRAEERAAAGYAPFSGPRVPSPGGGRAVGHPDRQPGLLALYRQRRVTAVRLPSARKPLARHARGPYAAGDHGPPHGPAGLSRLGSPHHRTGFRADPRTGRGASLADLRCNHPAASRQGTAGGAKERPSARDRARPRLIRTQSASEGRRTKVRPTSCS